MENLWSPEGDLFAYGTTNRLHKHISCAFFVYETVDQSQSIIYKKDWPEQPKELTGRFNCLHKPFVDPEKVFLPPLHLKLGLMKNFAKALDQGSNGFLFFVKVQR